MPKRLFVGLFLVADTSVRLLVRLLVRQHESKSGKTSILEVFCVCVCVGKGVGWNVGCGRPCPPVRNDIVTLRHLLDASSHLYKRVCPCV